MRGAFQNSGFALSSPRKLIRNLVECAGMICEGGDDEDHVEWLLGIMGDRRLDDVTRYNAARALERSHPWAPRPYFDYMSDWGDRDWKEVRTRAATDKISPWAVRGYRIREAAGAESEEVFHRNPRVFPYMAVCKGDKIRPLLQARVSETVGNLLLDLLHQLPESPERQNEETYRPIDLLLINFSHAWVRWYHSEHSPLLRDVRNSATKNQACKETQENLETWVDHGALRYS
jgi:hypothetical protein